LRRTSGGPVSDTFPPRTRPAISTEYSVLGVRPSPALFSGSPEGRQSVARGANPWDHVRIPGTLEGRSPRPLLPDATMRFRFLLALLLLATPQTASAVEPWADPKLPVTDGLELWLDAGHLDPAAKET